MSSTGRPHGEPVISPSTFPDLLLIDDYRRVADEVREATNWFEATVERIQVLSRARGHSPRMRVGIPS